jgi:hypothetical protein
MCLLELQQCMHVLLQCMQQCMHVLLQCMQQCMHACSLVVHLSLLRQLTLVTPGDLLLLLRLLRLLRLLLLLLPQGGVSVIAWVFGHQIFDCLGLLLHPCC